MTLLVYFSTDSYVIILPKFEFVSSSLMRDTARLKITLYDTAYNMIVFYVLKTPEILPCISASQPVRYINVIATLISN